MKKSDDSGWWQFLKLCTQLKNVQALDEWLTLLLTPTERDEIAKRYQIIDGLLRGEKTQREIAKQLGVGIAQITRGSNELKRTASALQKKIRAQMIK